MNKWYTLIFLFLMPLMVKGQDVCVISPFKLGKVKGVVVAGNKAFPVEHAIVKIVRRSKPGKVIKQTATNDTGYFEINNLPTKKYMLIVSFPNTETLYIPIKLARKRTFRRLILNIKLNGLIGEPCGGGEVKLVKNR